MFLHFLEFFLIILILLPLIVGILIKKFHPKYRSTHVVNAVDLMVIFLAMLYKPYLIVLGVISALYLYLRYFN